MNLNNKITSMKNNIISRNMLSLNINFNLPLSTGSGLDGVVLDFWDGVFEQTTGKGWWPPTGLGARRG